MTVSEFNRTISKDKLTLPPTTEVRIIERRDDEVKVEVLGKVLWVKARKAAIRAPVPTWEERYNAERPSYSMDKSEIALGPSAYMLLQWIRSLSSSDFSIIYAARELDMSRKTIRKSLQILRAAGKLQEEVMQ